MGNIWSKTFSEASESSKQMKDGSSSMGSNTGTQGGTIISNSKNSTSDVHSSSASMQPTMQSTEAENVQVYRHTEDREEEDTSVEDIVKMIEEVLWSGNVSELKSLIRQVIKIFKYNERNLNMQMLHKLYDTVTYLFSLNSSSLIHLLFDRELVYDIVSILEYDPSSSRRNHHRKFLKDSAKFVNLSSVQNNELEDLIKKTFIMEYFRNYVLPVHSFLEENKYSSLVAIIMENKYTIINFILNDESYVKNIITSVRQDLSCISEVVNTLLFLKELCSGISCFPPSTKMRFCCSLIKSKVLDFIEILLKSSENKEVQMLCMEILHCMTVFHTPAMREYLVRSCKYYGRRSILSLIILNLIKERDSESPQSLVIIGILNQLVDFVNYPEKQKKEFMASFTVHGCQPLMEEIINLTSEKDIYTTAVFISSMLDIITMCITQQSPEICSLVMEKNLLFYGTTFLDSKYQFLSLALIRLYQSFLQIKSKMCRKYSCETLFISKLIYKHINNKSRHNMLDSAVLSIFDIVLSENIDSLVVSIMSCYEKDLKPYLSKQLTMMKSRYDEIRKQKTETTRPCLFSMYEQVHARSRTRSEVPYAVTNVSAKPRPRTSLQIRTYASDRQNILFDTKKVKDQESAIIMVMPTDEPFLAEKNIYATDAESSTPSAMKCVAVEPKGQAQVKDQESAIIMVMPTDEPFLAEKNIYATDAESSTPSAMKCVAVEPKGQAQVKDQESAIIMVMPTDEPFLAEKNIYATDAESSTPSAMKCVAVEPKGQAQVKDQESAIIMVMPTDEPFLAEKNIYATDAESSTPSAMKCVAVEPKGQAQVKDQESAIIMVMPTDEPFLAEKNIYATDAESSTPSAMKCVAVEPKGQAQVKDQESAIIMVMPTDEPFLAEKNIYATDAESSTPSAMKCVAVEPKGQAQVKDQESAIIMVMPTDEPFLAEKNIYATDAESSTPSAMKCVAVEPKGQAQVKDQESAIIMVMPTDEPFLAEKNIYATDAESSTPSAMKCVAVEPKGQAQVKDQESAIIMVMPTDEPFLAEKNIYATDAESSTPSAMKCVAVEPKGQAQVKDQESAIIMVMPTDEPFLAEKNIYATDAESSTPSAMKCVAVEPKGQAQVKDQESAIIMVMPTDEPFLAEKNIYATDAESSTPSAMKCVAVEPKGQAQVKDQESAIIMVMPTDEPFLAEKKIFAADAESSTPSAMKCVAVEPKGQAQVENDDGCEMRMTRARKKRMVESKSEEEQGRKKRRCERKIKSAVQKPKDKRRRKQQQRQNIEPCLDEASVKEEWEVQEVRGIRLSEDNSKHYLLRWKNFPPTADSWEPESNVKCRKLIRDFLHSIAE